MILSGAGIVLPITRRSIFLMSNLYTWFVGEPFYMQYGIIQLLEIWF
jgi:hypothetical protein